MILRNLRLALMLALTVAGWRCAAEPKIDGMIAGGMSAPSGDEFVQYNFAKQGSTATLTATSSQGGPPVTRTSDTDKTVITSMPCVVEWTVKDPSGAYAFGTPTTTSTFSKQLAIPADADYYTVDVVIRNADSVQNPAKAVHLTFPLICTVHISLPADDYKGIYSYDANVANGDHKVNNGKGGSVLTTEVRAYLGPESAPYTFPAQNVKWSFQRPPEEQYVKRARQGYPNGQWYITPHWLKVSDNSEIPEAIGASGFKLKIVGTPAPSLSSTFGKCQLVAKVSDAIGSKTLKTFFSAKPSTNAPTAIGPGVDHPTGKWELDGSTRKTFAPNWFYYWIQTSALYTSAAAQYGYDPVADKSADVDVNQEAYTAIQYAWADQENHIKYLFQPPEVHIGPDCGNGGSPGSPYSLEWQKYTYPITGISNFANVMRHEYQHAENAVNWFTTPAKDSDNDGIPDDIEDKYTKLSPTGQGGTLFGFHTVDLNDNQIPLVFDKKLKWTNHSKVTYAPDGSIIETVEPKWKQYNDEELLTEALALSSKAWKMDEVAKEDWSTNGEQFTRSSSQIRYDTSGSVLRGDIVQSKEVPMTLRNRIAVTVLPLALAGPMARGAGGSMSDTQNAAYRRSAAVNAWIDSLGKREDLSTTQRISMIVEALRKELASPAPTLRIAGKGDIATQDVNFSNGIQMDYIVALIQTGDLAALQAAVLQEHDANVRDRLLIAIGRVFITKPDPRQAAVYPRIIELVKTNTEASAKFPYEDAVYALGCACRYPSLAGEIVPLLTDIAVSGGVGADMETKKINSLAATAAKDGLHFWGYSLVRDAKGQLQAVPKAQSAAKK